jgi:hypothetical protein
MEGMLGMLGVMGAGAKGLVGVGEFIACAQLQPQSRAAISLARRAVAGADLLQAPLSSRHRHWGS